MTTADLLLLALLLGLAAVLAWSRFRLRRTSAARSQASQDRLEAIAARSAVQAELSRGRDYLAALGAANPQALLLLDGKRQIVWGNAAAWAMFDSGEKVIGQPFINLVQDFELNQAVLDAEAGRRPIARQAAVSGRTLRIQAMPVEGAGGAAVVIEDVTELQRLGRARRDFVANLSHELRTPLANIDLAAQTLRKGGTSNPVISERMLDQIENQVRVLSQLSQEMLDLAQIESGQVMLKLVPAELEPLVRHSVVHLLPQAAQKDQLVSLLVPADLRALMDEQQVGRAISNLVHNAVKFTPEGGTITIRAEAQGADDVLLCVSDTGPGIPEDQQLRIFERFYKQDRARTQGGTGLGLAIARHIVEGHGGRIWVESTPGRGARFCLTLPRA